MITIIVLKLLIVKIINNGDDKNINNIIKKI
jgi:hypothetical protein